MKNIQSIFVLTLLFSTTSFSQTEPEAINAKDLIDKVDRSELVSDPADTDLENLVPEFEIPKMEFRDNIKKSSDAKVSQSKNLPKKENIKSTEIKKTSKPTPENKVQFAKSPIRAVELLQNDKIVIKNEQTYVYRLNNNVITQYKLNEKLPLKSMGLKTNGKDSFYIVDVSQLKEDVKALNSVDKNPIPINKISNVAQINKVELPVSKPGEPEAELPDSELPDSELAASRKTVEDNLNYGKSITRELDLKGLKINDKIVITHGVQLVIRKKKSTSGTNKYWLTEKIDTQNESLVEKSNNVYKLIKSYQ